MTRPLSCVAEVIRLLRELAAVERRRAYNHVAPSVSVTSERQADASVQHQLPAEFIEHDRQLIDPGSKARVCRAASHQGGGHGEQRLEVVVARGEGIGGD